MPDEAGVRRNTVLRVLFSVSTNQRSAGQICDAVGMRFNDCYAIVVNGLFPDPEFTTAKTHFGFHLMNNIIR